MVRRGVLAGNGHGALAGRKVLEKEQVMGNLGTMSGLESVLAFRGTPGGVRWTGGDL